LKRSRLGYRSWNMSRWNWKKLRLCKLNFWLSLYILRFWLGLCDSWLSYRLSDSRLSYRLSNSRLSYWLVYARLCYWLSDSRLNLSLWQSRSRSFFGGIRTSDIRFILFRLCDCRCIARILSFRYHYLSLCLQGRFLLFLNFSSSYNSFSWRLHSWFSRYYLSSLLCSCLIFLRRWLLCL